MSRLRKPGNVLGQVRPRAAVPSPLSFRLVRAVGPVSRVNDRPGKAALGKPRQARLLSWLRSRMSAALNLSAGQAGGVGVLMQLFC